MQKQTVGLRCYGNAIVRGTKTVLAIKAVLDFVQPHLSGSSAIGMHNITKGLIGLCFHFLRGLVLFEQLLEHGVASAEQHANISNEACGRDTFRRHRDFLVNLP